MIKSPWTSQINKRRQSTLIESDLSTENIIVGGGISGIVTAYNILKRTKEKVIILEAREIAHGATGHNAGQLVSTFERSLSSMVHEYGLQDTINLVKNINTSWIELETIITDLGLNIQYSTFLGYDLFQTEAQILNALHDIRIMDMGLLPYYNLYIAEDNKLNLSIPDELLKYIEYIPHESILSLGETVNTDYVAALRSKKGCLNSALLTEEILHKLIDIYSDRISVYEHSEVKKIFLLNENVKVAVNGYYITAKNVILCTNGFENFKIENNIQIETDFKKNIKGLVGYMMAKTEVIDSNPSAFSYSDYNTKQINGRDIIYDNDYIYTTRRHYDLKGEDSKNLFCIGGMGTVLEDTTTYNKSHIYSDDVKIYYENYILKNLKNHSHDTNSTTFLWHGLMGYTSDGLRKVGPHPQCKNLYFNLGCNGVGILTSIYGSKRLVDIMLGENSKCLFDINY